MAFGRVNPPGLVYKIDLSKIADRANPRTVENAIHAQTSAGGYTIDWGDGTTEVYAANSAVHPTHTYAEGAGDVFTVVIRSATGTIPRPQFCNSLSNSENTNPTFNLTLAVVSIDHFAGWAGTQSSEGNNGYNYACKSLTYTDPRFFGLPRWRSARWAFKQSGITQPLASFCFDFCVADGEYTYEHTFHSAQVSGDIPAGIFAQNTASKSFAATFYGCSALTGPPFVFWKEDGTLDTAKYPNLTTGASCYSACSAALRAQVPEAYGGTMTVS